MDPVKPKCPIKLLPVKQVNNCGLTLLTETAVYSVAATVLEIR